MDDLKDSWAEESSSTASSKWTVMVKGDEMATFLDLMGEVLVHEHLFYEVSRELDWETLARLDVKFWAWFWPWYEEVNRMWSFVNLAGTIEVDHEK